MKNHQPQTSNWSIASRRGLRCPKFGSAFRRLFWCLVFGVWCLTPLQAQTNELTYPIDLPTTLRLAGAQNLDVQIARERLNEARANHQAAVQQFFPWITGGIAYHRRDGVAQSVPSGIISDAHYQSYNPGLALNAQIPLGDALYNSLASKQTLSASTHALETQRQDSILQAAQAYFELVKAKALEEVLNDSVKISHDYQQELHDAVNAGIAFKGDELRVQSQTQRFQVNSRRAVEQVQITGAELLRILHLDPKLQLVVIEPELVPLTLIETNVALAVLVERALTARPELKEAQFAVAAERETRKGAVYGPIIPSLNAQVFGGGLGGGPDGGPSNLGAEGDYLVGLSWRFGPGGLFDAARVKSTDARLAEGKLVELKLKDDIVAQVVAGLARVRSLADQIDLDTQNLATATEALRLTRQRKQYGVGVVLEDIQAQQDLVQARSDYFNILAEYNKAQYGLVKASGSFSDSSRAK